MVKRLAVLLVLVLCSTGSLLAQGNNFYEHTYGFFAAGGVSGNPAMQLGGGGEFGVNKALGVGVELGYLTRFRDLGGGVGVFSPDIVYQFETSNTRLIPFVAGGYSLVFRSGTANGFNFGIGTHYLLNERAGLRMEFRDQAFDFGNLDHAYGFRIGITFR